MTCGGVSEGQATATKRSVDVVFVEQAQCCGL